MAGIGKPKKLIRYASFNQINNVQKFKFSPRLIIYTILLVVLTALMSYLFVSRGDVSITIVRAKGLLYQERPGNNISNLYTAKLINETPKKLSVNFQLEALDGTVELAGNENLELKSHEITQATFFVIINQNTIRSVNTKIRIGIYSKGKKIKTVGTTFIGKQNSNNQTH